MLHVIFQHIKAKKLASFAVVLSIALCVAVTFAASIVYMGTEAGLKRSAERLGADIVAVPEDAADELDGTDLLLSGAYACVYMDADLIDEIRELSGVEQVTAQFYTHTIVNASCCSAGLDARVMGIDLETDWIVKPWLEDENIESLGEGEVIVGSGVNPDAGDTLEVLGKTFHVVGRLDQTSTSFDNSILMSMEDSRNLVEGNEQYAFLWKKYGQPEDLITTVMVKVKDGSRVEDVAGGIRHVTGCETVISGDVLSDMQEHSWVVLQIMLAVVVVLLVACAVQLVARFITMTWDRKGEFALYSALGATKGYLQKLVVGEMGVFVVSGYVLGLVLGVLFTLYILNVVLAGATLTFLLPSAPSVLLVLLGVLCLFVVIGLCSVIVPVRQAAKISPDLAMRESAIE